MPDPVFQRVNLPKPTVFLFGAGATRGAFLKAGDVPPPVDRDFFDIAAQVRGRGTPVLAKKVLRDVWSLYRETSGVSLEAYYRDVETREKIGSFAGGANRPKDWRRRRQDLEELIRRVLIQTTCDTAKNPAEPRKSQLHGKILDHLESGDTILTFNYDTVIEEAFDTGAVWTPRGGYGTSERIYGTTHAWAKNWLKHRDTGRSQASKVLLLKLHGSLNWNVDGNGFVRLKPRPYVVRSSAKESIGILPPGWNKQVDRNPYKAFWREARRRLENCRALVIIGYSLPDADLLARALFAEVVRTVEGKTAHRHLRELHLADPAESVVQKLTKLFTPALGAAGRVFRYRDIAEFQERLCA